MTGLSSTVPAERPTATVLADVSNTQQSVTAPPSGTVRKQCATPGRSRHTVPKPFNLHTTKRATAAADASHSVRPMPPSLAATPTSVRLRSAGVNPVTPHRTITALPATADSAPARQLPTFPVPASASDEEFCEDATSLAAILNPQNVAQLDPRQMAERLSMATRRVGGAIDRASIYGGALRVLIRPKDVTQTPNRRATMLDFSVRSAAASFNSHYYTPARAGTAMPQRILHRAPHPTPVAKQ